MLGTRRFDYIVVGAGTAGCVLADSLSADRSKSVLLVEAGPDASTDPRITNASAWPALMDSEYDWAYRCVPQANLGGRVVRWPRGRVVGGSSCLNAMVYIRGNAIDFDTWAEYGGESWGAAAMSSVFDQLERGSTTGGSLSVVAQEHPHPLSLAFVAAGVELGLPRNVDFNSGSQEGVGIYRLMQRDGLRCSAADAYLAAAIGRPNLVLLPGSRVARVLVDRQQAVGVRVWLAGTAVDFIAEAEVILCAGAIESPRLLMLSGIGPAAHLRAHGIEVHADLPGVGGNLHDHVQAWVDFRCDAAQPLWPGSNLGEAGGFVTTNPDSAAPDVQLSFLPMLGFDAMSEAGRGFIVGSAVTRPRSRGRLLLGSPDIWRPPVIDPNYLADPHDVDVLASGVELALALANTRSLGQFRDRNDDDPAPRDIVQFCRDRADTQFHPVGTCRFGTDDDAVVDPQLRVHGVGGLRVVDASVIPAITTGNVAAPVFAIATKASAMIGGTAEATPRGTLSPSR